MLESISGLLWSILNSAAGISILKITIMKILAINNKSLRYFIFWKSRFVETLLTALTNCVTTKTLYGTM